MVWLKKQKGILFFSQRTHLEKQYFLPEPNVSVTLFASVLKRRKDMWVKWSGILAEAV